MGRFKRFFFGGRKRSSSVPNDPATMESSAPPKRQSAIRRSMRRIRKSFHKKEGYVPPASKPHIYAEDEKLVRAANCRFNVKYLGSIEVTESRGMTVCEDAAKRLRLNPKKKTRAVLWVSSDALRVVEEESKGLIVDQTIEKVSFCAPDRNNDRGFAYISRDGTTRRWLCHCFHSLKEPGERLSHAVGCAFAACLERKQQRDKLCGVQIEFDVNKTSFTRQGSFRQMTMTEQLEAEQKENEKENTGAAPPKPVVNPYAIPRRHATEEILVRQGSMRMGVLNNNTPFKRNLSLRLNELPSTLQRQQQVLETVPDMSPTSPTAPNQFSNHGNTTNGSLSAAVHQLTTGLSALAEQPEPAELRPGRPGQAQVQAQVHPQVAPVKPLQPVITNQPQPTMIKQKPNPAQTTNPWGEPPVSYNPWSQPAPPPLPERKLNPADQWLEQTSLTVQRQQSPPLVNGNMNNSVQNGVGTTSGYSVSVNHNNANVAPKNGINGTWTAEISQSLPPTRKPENSKPVDPEFEAKWASLPTNSEDPNNPFNNAVKTFEINL